MYRKVGDGCKTSTSSGTTCLQLIDAAKTARSFMKLDTIRALEEVAPRVADSSTRVRLVECGAKMECAQHDTSFSGLPPP